MMMIIIKKLNSLFTRDLKPKILELKITSLKALEWTNVVCKFKCPLRDYNSHNNNKANIYIFPNKVTNKEHKTRYKWLFTPVSKQCLSHSMNHKIINVDSLQTKKSLF